MEIELYKENERRKRKLIRNRCKDDLIHKSSLMSGGNDSKREREREANEETTNTNKRSGSVWRVWQMEAHLSRHFLLCLASIGMDRSGFNVL